MITEGYETPIWYLATCFVCDEPTDQGDLCADCIEMINLTCDMLDESLAHRLAT